ncbi:type II toxin-antitoxin system VapC family toxin [Skermania sp. ID1734]|uniref:type II toxin-antitoxin system VapC family toxin n=1 Tax=Skermania sp. ID1734 TaxID=2597516 RepID=UPI0021034AA6|nr:type II toxin-antitoxin system VapC family toxin [Skermania sp. ID1734]
MYALNEDSAHHAQYRNWLVEALRGVEPVGVSELVLAGVVRILTNHRIFERPSSTQEALDYCAAIRAAPSAVPLQPGPRHWALFAELCAETAAKGNIVPDAYHAALAIENGATWITNDRGFARFPKLMWRKPFD